VAMLASVSHRRKLAKRLLAGLALVLVAGAVVWVVDEVQNSSLQAQLLGKRGANEQTADLALCFLRLANPAELRPGPT